MSTLGQVVLIDVIANRPTASIAGRLFFATDQGVTYRDNGSTWDIYGSYYGSGPTAGRPVVTGIGISFFDTTLGYMIWWNGAAWVDDTGTPR